jgi:hypothetical protein
MSSPASKHVPSAVELSRAARIATGLTDFGPEPFEEALSVLLQAIGTEANFSADGLAAELAEIRTLLVNRLRIEAMFARFPEIRAEPIQSPVIIIGPQRSGTSKLFRSIAADPQWNFLPTWQAINPAPPGLERPAPSTADTRIHAGDQWVASMAGRQGGHSYETRSPEMEALLMRDSFLINAGKRLVPSHQSFVERADHRPVYRRLRRQLQLVQWQNRAAEKRWILKSPPHLLGLQALVGEFPDATLVMTHRHPAECIASMCRLAELAQRQTALSVNHALIGRCWSRVITLGLERFLEFEDSTPGARIVHVRYFDIERHLIPAIESIYAKADAPVTSHTLGAIETWEAANPRHKEGAFRYRLEDYGLNRETIEHSCQRWLHRYGHYL